MNMIDFKRLTALALSGILTLSLLSGCGAPAASAPAQSPAASPVVVADPDAITDICQFTVGLPQTQVVATVDGMEITAEELLYWIALYCDELLTYYGGFGLTEIPWDLPAQDGTLVQHVLKAALDRAALYHLVEERAGKEGLSVSQEQLDAVARSLETIQKDQQAAGVDMDQYLRRHVLTTQLYTWYCRCEYLIQALIDAHYGVATSNYPTDDQLREYAETTLGLYSTKHILLATLDTNTRLPLDADAAAKKKMQAEDLFKQLRDSSDPVALFETLMHKYSEDPGLKTNPDGYLAVAPGEFDPAYEQAALALEVGQISSVVEGASGYHIIQRLPLEINPAEYREMYINSKMSAEWDSWMAAADLQTNEAYACIDPKTFYNALNAYRAALTGTQAQDSN